MSPFGAGCAKQWGLDGDIPSVGDFDGDGKSDYVVVRRPSPPTAGQPLTWYIHWSSFAGSFVINYGVVGDFVDRIDYDADGKKDIAVYRPNDTPKPNWYSRNSTNGVTQIFQDISNDYNGSIWPMSGRWFPSPTQAVSHALARKTAPSTHYIVFQPAGFGTSYPLPTTDGWHECMLTVLLSRLVRVMRPT